MKYLSSFRSSLFFFSVVIGMSLVVSGCVATKEKKDTSSPIIQQQQYDKLIKVNEQQRSELKTFQQLSAQLQLNLLEKDVEVNRLTMMNEQLIREFVHKKGKLRNRGDKVETVSLLAEVATLIDTAKENQLTGSRHGLLLQAEQYQAESKVELDKGNYESAFHLAGQALKLVETIQLKVDNNTQQGKAVFVKFAVSLPMALLKTSNVRAKPSIQANVQRVLDAGSRITAVGYTGEWVKVKVPAQGLKSGWIHYALLGGTRE